ncbi:MAG: hypothetical protein KBC11_02670 [Candidatus Pacebacteria bacterium]|nr:hypothetical protein [Candidatus Paceibacterota bacterium]
MKKILFQIINTLEILFLLPYIIIGSIVVLIRTTLFNQKVSDHKDSKKKSLLISLILWLLIIGWNVYQNQFYYVNYVDACYTNSEDVSNCYKLRADILPGECSDTEYSKYASGGDCTAPSIDKIYFNKGGYKTFESCDFIDKNEWICTPLDEAEDYWYIKFIERVKIKK